jgi:hypothetical protein
MPENTRRIKPDQGIGETVIDVGVEPPPIPDGMKYAQRVGTIVRLSASEWALIIDITPTSVIYQKLVRTSLTSAPFSEIFPNG